MDILSILQELVSARGPCGQEEEVHTLCKQYMRPLCDELWTDPSGNLIGKISGNSGAPAIRIIAHMDELSMIVKRIHKDGRLRIEPLGGIYPANFGQGTVEIMGDEETILGVLSTGPMHVSQESKKNLDTRPKGMKGNGKAVEWDQIYVVTRKSKEELRLLGVHPGTRVVIAKERRKLQMVEDCVAGYFMDNRAAIVVMLETMRRLKESQTTPEVDVYFVASNQEEVGGFGACYASRTLPGETTIALDVGPIAEEYETTLSAAPIIVYGDQVGLYDKSVCDRLLGTSRKLKMETQCAIFSGYGSDASLAKAFGQAGKTGLLCIPTENTHGYEIIHKEAISQCAKLLTSFLSP
ncbi:MAG: M28 family peptidase [Chlamydiota bacterium]